MEYLVAPMLMIIGLILMVLAFVLWAWMLVDCIKYEPVSGNSVYIWGIVIVFVYPVGAFLYYLLRRPERIKQLGR